MINCYAISPENPNDTRKMEEHIIEQLKEYS